MTVVKMGPETASHLAAPFNCIWATPMENGGSTDDATAQERRLKRLKFRSWHRGTRELDLLLGPFADRHLDGLSDAEMRDYEALLTMPDPDVYDWILGQAEPPTEVAKGVLRLIKQFHKTD